MTKPRPLSVALPVPLPLALALLLIVALLPAGAARAHDVGCAEARPSAGEWPMFGGDVSASRSQKLSHGIDVVAAATLMPAWTFDPDRWTHQTGNEVTGYPVVSGGCVYVGSSTGNDAQGNHLPGWVFALNADNGDVVWQRQVAGGVYSTVAVDGGVVYAFVSRVSSPYVVALDERTGAVLWETVVDRQFGADAVSSPIVFDGMVWVGVSGTAAEGSPEDRTAFQGSGVLIATRRIEAPAFTPADAEAPAGTRTYEAGEVIRKAWSIPTSQWALGYAGGAQWSTIAIDPATRYGYVGTGNPFSYDAEHEHTNAVLKLDLDRSRATFGQYVGAYKGDIETLVEEVADAVPCDDLEELHPLAGAGFECAQLDLDFGATPNIVKDPAGRTVLVIGQKSGVVHVIDSATMDGVAATRLGVPSAVGGMVGSGATDGTSVFGAHTVGGYLYSVTSGGTPRWVAPVGDGVHWGNPVTHANGMVFTVDLKGFLDIYDAATGAPVAHRPMQLGADHATLTRPPLSWGGVSVARNTVYASVGVGLTSAGLPSVPAGFVIAFRPVRLM
jgi:polyvinyl alcohol dehydrogenase (cytochrome)